jgi:phosphate transport system substrate-binding protein
MKNKFGLGATAVALSLGMATAGIAPANAAGSLPGGGASFQSDFQTKCVNKFNAEKASVRKGITVSYNGTLGSGAGRTGLGNGSLKFAGSDSLGVAGSLTKDNSIWLPVVAAPLAIIVNLKSSTNSKITSLNLDAQVLNDIFRGSNKQSGGITNWNDSRIAALNKGLKLPNQAITVVSRNVKSGSTGNLKSYLSQNATNSGFTAGNEFNTEFATGKSGADGTEIANEVAATNGSIGYVDLSDVKSGTTVAAIKNVAGAFVKPTATAASNYVKASGVLTEISNANSTATNEGATYSVDFTRNVKSAYQISFISYMVLRNGLDTNGDALVYMNYMLNKCSPSPSAIGATGFTSPGASLITKAKSQLAKVTPRTER